MQPFRHGVLEVFGMKCREVHVKNKEIAMMLICIIVFVNGCTSNNDMQSNRENLTGSILYACDGDGASKIHKMKANGSSDAKVAGIPENAYGPVVSPDGKRLAFYCHVNDSQWSLYILNLENSEVKQLTNEVNCHDWAISWAPDNQWLYFTRSHMNAIWESEIWKINVVDTSLTSVIEKQAQGGALSPDGQSLLYFDYSEGGGDIWQYDLNTKASVQLTSNADEEWWPSWFPDGKNIVYQGKHEGNFELFSMNLENKQVTQLTASEGDEEEPQVSPDGRHIVYSYFSQGEYSLYVMNSDGTEATRLTTPGVQSMNPSWCR